MIPAIVLVDDSAVTLALIRRILQEAVPDYELVDAVNSAAALALIAERPVALVITDQHMPGMDGIALTAAIKAAVPQCPVILMTGAAGPELEQRAETVGVDYFLPKPFRFDQLATMVRAALGHEWRSLGQ